MSDQPDAPVKIKPKWKPIGRIQRRVLGVLVEKAKTTPDAYPLTLNALTNGCNQKSNRDPQMNLEPHQVETALESLRHQSAAMEIAGSGRVPKFRHLIYEWMGIEKEESAVMTELLLRGAQTLGELRGRAARMGSIPDIGALQPIVSGLVQKGLVIALSPQGAVRSSPTRCTCPKNWKKYAGNLVVVPAITPLRRMMETAERPTPIQPNPLPTSALPEAKATCPRQECRRRAVANNRPQAVAETSPRCVPRSNR